MIKNEKKIREIKNLVRKLDITLEMFNYAKSKYEKVAKYLEFKGIDANVYPQGSFALGTTVRPYREGKDVEYDLDAVCQLMVTSKDSIAPSELKENIERILSSKELEKRAITSYDECCTLEFKEVSGFEFSLDVLSAVDEDSLKKQDLLLRAEHPDLIDDAIAIPKKTPNSYRWMTNNPKGYKIWFDRINQKFLLANPIITRESIVEKYANKISIDDIDLQMERSALQIVIKILKRHRDVYFSRITNGDDIKPISAIITTLIASIANFANPYLDVFELLEYVLNDLLIYSKRQSLSEFEFSQAYNNKEIITRKSSEWRIENPANPDDNLANAWNSNPDLSRAFFEWIDIIISDFTNLEKFSDNSYITTLSNTFGSDIVKRSINIDDYAPKYQQPSVFSSSQKTKPYKSQNVIL